MKVFFDTSAFAKRYVDEAGSEHVQELCAQAESLVLSITCLPELISTLCRLVREGRITAANYQQTRKWLLDDFHDIDICELTPTVLKHTVRCLEHYPLRAMDAIHLGCALVSASDVFVSADRRQIHAARGEGLHVVAVLKNG